MHGMYTTLVQYHLTILHNPSVTQKHSRTLVMKHFGVLVINFFPVLFSISFVVLLDGLQEWITVPVAIVNHYFQLLISFVVLLEGRGRQERITMAVEFAWRRRYRRRISGTGRRSVRVRHGGRMWYCRVGELVVGCC